MPADMGEEDSSIHFVTVLIVQLSLCLLQNGFCIAASPTSPTELSMMNKICDQNFL